MRHLLVTWIFLLYVQISFGEFIDPTDLFNYDEMNVQLSKKPPERSNEEKTIELGDGQPEVLESPPSSSNVEDRGPASKTEDYKDKKPEALGSSQSSSRLAEHGNGNVVQESTLLCRDEIMTKAAFTLFQQFVMNFVQLSQGMVDDSNRQVEFCMRIRATQHDLTVLSKFGQGDDSAIHAAHERLSHLFQSACDLPDFSPILWLEKRLGLSTTSLSLIVASLLILLLIVKSLTSIRMTSSKIWFSMTAVFITSVAFTWMEMYQKKVAAKERVLTDEMFIRCPQYEKLNMWERFTTFLSSSVTFQDENCREFYEALIISPITQVSPLEAVAVAVVKTFVAPCKIIGGGIKDLFIGLFKDLPAQYAGYLMFLMTVAAFVIFLYIPLLVFRCRIRIPFLLSIEPHTRPEVAQDREVPREAIQAREEKGQGDGVQYSNTIMPPSPSTLRRREFKDKGFSSPPSSARREILSSQEKALQKYQTEMKERNDLSKGPQNSHDVDSPSSLLTDGKKGQEKGTNSVVGFESVSCEQKMSKDQNDSVPEDLNFEDLQSSDCEESFTILKKSIYDTPSETKDSSDEPSEEDNLNLVRECDPKSFEKDLSFLNVRDTQ